MATEKQKTGLSFDLLRNMRIRGQIAIPSQRNFWKVPEVKSEPPPKIDPSAGEEFRETLARVRARSGWKDNTTGSFKFKPDRHRR